MNRSIRTRRSGEIGERTLTAAAIELADVVSMHTHILRQQEVRTPLAERQRKMLLKRLVSYYEETPRRCRFRT